jgi:hypothetical protein
MKQTIAFFLTAILFITGLPQALISQDGFDPEAYKLFIEGNKNFTTEELLENNPRESQYYNNRSIHTDLSTIPWFDSINRHFEFTSDEKAMLSKNHFMVSERLSHGSWAYAFIDVYGKDLPLFISSDFVLHTLHQSYDAVLKKIEVELLEPNLNLLLEAMLNACGDVYEKYSIDDRLIPALEDVDLYLSIAYSLAQGDTILPDYAAISDYYRVLDAVKSEKLTSMPLFTGSRFRKLDFSQFKPRGHYTDKIYTPDGTRTLENYFRAMMWLGRIDFLMTAPPENPWETNWTDAELQRMQLGALFLNEALHACGKKDLFDTHEQIISYLVGPDDNLTPAELKGLSDNILTNPADILDSETYNRFTDSLNSSDDHGQKIMSNFFYVDPNSDEPGKLPISFKLLGQKFLLDSYITAEVVYDRIIWNGDKIYRDMPDPLDVLSVLGNENAMELMKEEMETYHYAYKINELKELIGYYNDDFWEQSLYNVWLSSIKTLNPQATTYDLPYFMQTTAWHHEKLNTQLASWAELRHDNILYGKQSYTGGTGCSFPYTYVEPYPELYRKIQLFANNAAGFFSSVLSDDTMIPSFFRDYAGIMEKFESIAVKELEGTPLNDDEITFLKTMINGMMASGPSITGWYNDLFFDPMKGLQEDYLVADIHTQPTDKYGNVVGHVYHVGTGKINKGIFLAPNPVNPDQLMAFTGPVSTYMYEVTNNFYRYDDDEWRQNIWSIDCKAQRPDWVAEYLVDNNGKEITGGRRLKGSTYMVSSVEENIKARDLDYLIVFPNPVEDVAHLRFILNKPGEVWVEVYDLHGRVLHQKYHGSLAPAEHDISINVAGIPPGNYLVRFMYNGKYLTRKLQVQR